MAAPAGATHVVKPTVQAAQVAWSGTQEWPLNLLCVCDMDEEINTGAQSFVAGLAADLSDLEITDAADNPIPWRRAEGGLFSQEPGHEKLWVRVRDDLSGDSNTEFRAYRGCTAPTGEDDGSGVVGAATSAYYPMEGAGTLEDWANDLELSRNGYSEITGKVGKAQLFDGNDYGRHADDALFDLAWPITVSLWVKFTTTANRIILEKDQNDGYSVQVWQGKLHCNFGGSSAAWLRTASLWNDDAWHNVVFVARGVNNGEVYVDGADDLGNEDPKTPSYASGPFDLGGRGTNYGHIGDIDEVMLIDGYGWSADEAATYYNMTSEPASWCVCGTEEALVSISPPIGCVGPAVRLGPRASGRAERLGPRADGPATRLGPRSEPS